MSSTTWLCNSSDESVHGGTLWQEGTEEVVYKGPKQSPGANKTAKGRDQTFQACARIIATDGGTVLASSSGGPPSQVTYYEMEGASGPNTIIYHSTKYTEHSVKHFAPHTTRRAVTFVVLMCDITLLIPVRVVCVHSSTQTPAKRSHCC